MLQTLVAKQKEHFTFITNIDPSLSTLINICILLYILVLKIATLHVLECGLFYPIIDHKKLAYLSTLLWLSALTWL